MHIQTVNIHLSTPALGAALLSALLRIEPAAEPEGAAVAEKTTPPAIGQPWPGIDGVYAGVSRGEGDEPDAHLVLLNAVPDRDMKWDDAVAWAQGVGDGARLPTRFESALLYAHLQDKVDTARWHWTGTQYSSSGAWSQLFGGGLQGGNGKKFEALARAVRRLIL